MVYTGKLIIGRYDTVKLIGKALDEINADKTRVILDVYTTTELTSEEKNNLSKFVNLLGAIPQDEVFSKQNKLIFYCLLRHLAVDLPLLRDFLFLQSLQIISAAENVYWPLEIKLQNFGINIPPVILSLMFRYARSHHFDFLQSSSNRP